MITGESGILRLGILIRDFPFGLCPELLQAGNATHSNKWRPAPCLARGAMLVFFRP